MLALSALPPLKPNQPNQMRTVPRKTIVTLWGLSGGALEVVFGDSIDDKLTDVFLVQRPALAQYESVCKTCRAGRDVHRPTASEVEGTELVQPAVGVPCPVGNRAVADSAEEWLASMLMK